MSYALVSLLALALLLALGLAVRFLLRPRGLDRCLLTYLRTAPRRRPPRPRDEIHLLLCIADHFEPAWGNAGPDIAARRVADWIDNYPRLFGEFRDSDGRPPQHSFFFPLDQYDPAHLDALAGLCRAGFGEVEFHLHHHDDSAPNLRRTLRHFADLFATRHGLLARRRTGEIAFGFIHGNWALDNARPDGRWCGVNNELDVLRECGCYADFTLPSVPSPTQTRKINSIYWAIDDPNRPRSHDWGIDVGAGPAPSDALMLIQGPLVLNWCRRRSGLIPRIENGCLQANQPPDIARLDLWLRARVQVPSRPDWFFVKLHTHGAPEANRRVLLGEPAVRFHQALARRLRDDPRFHLHYVTARQMYNLARAAEAGWTGTVADARDFELQWNGQAHPDPHASSASSPPLAGSISSPA